MAFPKRLPVLLLTVEDFFAADASLLRAVCVAVSHEVRNNIEKLFMNI